MDDIGQARVKYCGKNEQGIEPAAKTGGAP
jgi:hypothetical protein